MKCPFRTITKTETSYGSDSRNAATYCKPIDSVVTVDFAECIEKDCPYFGKMVYELTDNGMKKSLQPICRKANE